MPESIIPPRARALLIEISGLPEDGIDSARLGQELDSLCLMEWFCAIEEEYEVELNDLDDTAFTGEANVSNIWMAIAGVLNSRSDQR